MGGRSSSVLDDLRKNSDFPENETFAGLENFGNTCYANSVLQSLYSCTLFRSKLQTYREQKIQEKRAGLDIEHSLLNCLADTFYNMKGNPSTKRVHVVRPRLFIQTLQKENEFFRGPQQQDAQEFMMYLLNEINDVLTKEEKKRRALEGIESDEKIETWVQDIFEGVLTNETQCIRCLRTSTRDEVFLDLSVDINANCSIYNCLKKFSTNTMLTGNDKYMCDNCRCRQEAFKRMRIKKLPRVLVLHLKRFKYIEKMQQYAKLRYPVAFPFHLKIPNTSEGSSEDYNLFAIVVHVGASPRFGHYVACVKYHHLWFLFDDDKIKHVNKSWVEELFGSQGRNHVKDAYLLFYERANAEPVSPNESETPV